MERYLGANMENKELLEALQAALAEISATGMSEGVFFGADKDIENKLEHAIFNIEYNTPSRLFHAAWAKAKESADYDKRSFQYVQRWMEKLEPKILTPNAEWRAPKKEAQ